MPSAICGFQLQPQTPIFQHIRMLSLSLAAAVLWVIMLPGPAYAQWTCDNSPCPPGSISYSGNVGIGTGSPAAPLDINGAMDLRGTLRTFDASSTERAQLDYEGTSWLIRDVSTGTDQWWALFAPGQYIGFFGGGNNNSNARFIINNGYVGIGTASPQQLLDVAGTMAAREVIVTQTGADYVFDPYYHLAPLSEVASYIKDHHHLPDIPSATEMKEKGVGVADMQAKLLAKIEELTLHMIQAEKENQELRERIARLEAAASQ